MPSVRSQAKMKHPQLQAKADLDAQLLENCGSRLERATAMARAIGEKREIAAPCTPILERKRAAGKQPLFFWFPTVH